MNKEEFRKLYEGVPHYDYSDVPELIGYKVLVVCEGCLRRDNEWVLVSPQQK